MEPRTETGSRLRPPGVAIEEGQDIGRERSAVGTGGSKVRMEQHSKIFFGHECSVQGLPRCVFWSAAVRGPSGAEQGRNEG